MSVSAGLAKNHVLAPRLVKIITEVASVAKLDEVLLFPFVAFPAPLRPHESGTFFCASSIFTTKRLSIRSRQPTMDCYVVLTPALESGMLLTSDVVRLPRRLTWSPAKVELPLA